MFRAAPSDNPAQDPPSYGENQRAPPASGRIFANFGAATRLAGAGAGAALRKGAADSRER